MNPLYMHTRMSEATQDILVHKGICCLASSRFAPGIRHGSHTPRTRMEQMRSCRGQHPLRRRPTMTGFMANSYVNGTLQANTGPVLSNYGATSLHKGSIRIQRVGSNAHRQTHWNVMSLALSELVGRIERFRRRVPPSD